MKFNKLKRFCKCYKSNKYNYKTEPEISNHSTNEIINQEIHIQKLEEFTLNENIVINKDNNTDNDTDNNDNTDHDKEIINNQIEYDHDNERNNNQTDIEQKDEINENSVEPYRLSIVNPFVPNEKEEINEINVEDTNETISHTMLQLEKNDTEINIENRNMESIDINNKNNTIEDIKEIELNKNRMMRNEDVNETEKMEEKLNEIKIIVHSMNKDIQQVEEVIKEEKILNELDNKKSHKTLNNLNVKLIGVSNASIDPETGIVFYDLYFEHRFARKRFSDLKNLYVAIKKQIGNKLPKLPPHGLLTKFNKHDRPLIDERREAFEIILMAILKHPEAKNSQEFLNFW